MEVGCIFFILRHDWHIIPQTLLISKENTPFKRGGGGGTLEFLFCEVCIGEWQESAVLLLEDWGPPISWLSHAWNLPPTKFISSMKNFLGNFLLQHVYWECLYLEKFSKLMLQTRLEAGVSWPGLDDGSFWRLSLGVNLLAKPPVCIWLALYF